VFGTTRTALFILLLISISTPSLAWGPEGHRIVADIARSRLHEITRRHIRELLGDDDLATISTWANEIRPQRPETFGWHFVDIPMTATGFSEPEIAIAAVKSIHKRKPTTIIAWLTASKYSGESWPTRTNRDPLGSKLSSILSISSPTFINPCTRLERRAAEMRFRLRNLVLHSVETVCAISIPLGTPGLIEHAMRLGAPPFGPLDGRLAQPGPGEVIVRAAMS
jgi:S1/P1 Nuclease